MECRGQLVFDGKQTFSYARHHPHTLSPFLPHPRYDIPRISPPALSYFASSSSRASPSNSLYPLTQVSTSNSLELQEDPHEEVITEITSKLGLRRIGWIFTDLVADDLEKGTVKHFRGNVETHFLSGQVRRSIALYYYRK